MNIGKNRLKIDLIAILIVYMIYIPFLGTANISVAIAVLSILGIVPLINILTRHFGKREYRPVIIHAIFTMYMVLPIIYSANSSDGISWLIKNMCSLLTITAGITIQRHDKKKVMLDALLFAALPVGLSNILFLLSPTIESAFYNTSFSHMIVSPSSFVDMASGNIQDPMKAGTLFINANNASVYFMMLMMISFYMWKERKQKRYLYICLLYLFSVLSTGCRTGILALAICFFMYAFQRNRKILKHTMIVLLVIAAIGLIVYLQHIPFIDNLINRISIEKLTSDPRITIWGLAIKNFRFIGWGYGGWSNFSRTLPTWLMNMPQHNHMLIVGYIGGVLAIIIYLMFWFSLVNIGRRSKKLSPNYAQLLISISLIVLVHGFFDNYFLGNMNIISFVYFIIGYLMSKIDLKDGKNATRNVRISHTGCKLWKIKRAN